MPRAAVGRGSHRPRPAARGIATGPWSLPVIPRLLPPALTVVALALPAGASASAPVVYGLYRTRR